MIFGISGNYEKKEMPQIAAIILTKLKKEGARYVVTTALAKKLRGQIEKGLLNRSSVVTEEALPKSCNILISLGGDGTILRAARLLNGFPTPVLGINIGKLGFLAEVSVEEMDECLDEILRGDYEIEERIMLQARIGKSKKVMYALNDIVLDQADSSRMFSTHTRVNGEYLSSYTGDGIIIATPTGSTAYALSNGGPIVTPANNSILISPICPHTLTARTVVVPGESVIILEVGNATGKIHITADGQTQKYLSPPVEVKVERSMHSMKLVKRKNRSYYDVLRRKLHWGMDVRTEEKDEK
jgi:NAD+ kinase